MGIEAGIPVLFSTEKARCALVPCPGENPADYQVVRTRRPHLGAILKGAGPPVRSAQPLVPQVPGFRVRTIPVLGATPALFGQAMAAWVLCTLAKQPFSGEPPYKPRSEQAQQQLDRLVEREALAAEVRAAGGAPDPAPAEEMVRVDLDDVNYLIGDLWGGRSAFALSGEAEASRAEAGRCNAGKNAARKGTWRDLRPLCLVRWDLGHPATVDNLVLMSADEAEAHEAAGGAEGTRRGRPAEAAFIEGMLATAAREHGVVPWWTEKRR